MVWGVLYLLVSNWSTIPCALAATEAATRQDDHTAAAAAAAVTVNTGNTVLAITPLVMMTEATTVVFQPLKGTRDSSRKELSFLIRKHRDNSESLADRTSSLFTLMDCTIWKNLNPKNLLFWALVESVRPSFAQTIMVSSEKTAIGRASEIASWAVAAA